MTMGQRHYGLCNRPHVYTQKLNVLFKWRDPLHYLSHKVLLMLMNRE